MAFDVKSRPCDFSAQTIEKIAQDFFAKFADYFSRFAILKAVWEIISNIANPESRRGLR